MIGFNIRFSDGVGVMGRDCCAVRQADKPCYKAVIHLNNHEGSEHTLATFRLPALSDLGLRQCIISGSQW